MAKKSRKLKGIIACLLAATVVAGGVTAGSLAYLTDDASDVNVMTLGNVYIDQIEQQRGESGLEDFEDDKRLYPAVYGDTAALGEDGYWTSDVKNAVDKIVTVKNTGDSSAYVRTWFAFEQGDMSKADFEKYLVRNVNEANWTWDWDNAQSNVVVDKETEEENKYYIVCATYNKVLDAGATTEASLLQVMLDKTANNEQVEAIDGNADGNYDILVVSQAIQTEGFGSASAALTEGFGSGHPFNGVKADHTADTWDGTADTAWYDDNTDATEFTLTTASEFAGLAELVNNGTEAFTGKTITLDRNLDLSEENFVPIGGVDKGYAFEGTFDGQGHTITGLTQNGWELGYEYGQQAGMGLFGWTYNSTIKNVTVDSAEVSMEAVVMGVVAGYATGDCTFENITVSNTQIANYNWDTGGIVGQVYNSGENDGGDTFTFKNITIDSSTTVSGHWGTWDVSAGGVIGRTANGVNVVMEDVTVACELDVYNDVCAAYQWYAYRYSGMLVGYTKTTETVDGRTVATAPHVTCKNVTVIYDDWANYTYCQATNVAPQYVRVQGGYSTDPYYSGRHWTAGVDANGNKMVDDNHVHADGEAHNELIVFDQLFGGGQGVYGTATHDGVTVVYNNK